MYVFSNHAISLDGRLGPDYEHFVALGSEEDLRRLRLYRDEADAVIVGGRTLRCWPHPSLGAAGRPIWNAVLTSRGLWGAQGIPGAWTHRWRGSGARLLILGGPPPEDLPADCGESVAHAAPTFAWALEQLRERGCERVVLEGGGALVQQALDAAVLHEMRVTLCPLLIGAQEGPSLLPQSVDRGGTRLRLVRAEIVGNEVFVRYRVERGEQRAAGP